MESTLVPEHELHRLKFSFSRSIRYHDCRGNFLRSLSRFCSLLTLLLGSGAALAVFKEWPKSVQLSLPFGVAVISLTNLLFDFRGCGDLHRKLSSKFSELLHDLDTCSERTPEALRRFEKKRRDLENEAPTPLKMLDVCCHNDLVRAEGYDSGEFVDLQWWQVALRQFCSIGRIPPKRRDVSRTRSNDKQ